MLARLRSGVRNILKRDRVEQDLDDEVRAALDLLTDEHRRKGMSTAEARRAAFLQLGGVESVKGQVRDVRAGVFLDTLLQDLHQASRLLLRNPLFTLTAALSLAIGIGATTTIFTVVNGLLLRSAIGVVDSGRLVDIVRVKDGGGPGIDPVSFPDYLEIRRQATTVDGVYAYQLELPAVSFRVEETGAVRAYAGVVTTNYFQALGVTPAAGRMFSPGDSEEAGASPIAVLSHRFWQRRFNGDPGVVGRTVYLNGYPLTIVGVARQGFLGMTVVAPDVWIPTSMVAVSNPEAGARLLTTRGADWLMLGARLKPGASRSEASVEMAAIGAALAREFPVAYDVIPVIPPGVAPGTISFSWKAVPSSPIPSGLRVIVGGFLALLMSIVSVVLIIACANVAGVLLARGVVRRREIAVRSAIGAGRARVVRQLLTETVLLFALGGAMGLILARAMTSLLVLSLPAFPLPVNPSLPLDARVVAFSLSLSFVAAVLSGLAPALRASRPDVVAVLKDDALAPTDRLRLRNTFVVAQVAFSILLVITAGILVRDVDRVTSIDRGFDSRQIDIATVNLSMAGYTAESGAAFARQLIEGVRALPGVEVATLADRLPGPGTMVMGGLSVPGVLPPQGLPYFFPNWNVVDSGYFTTLRIPLIAGRDFSDADRAGMQRVAIIGEAAARQWFPGKSAVGQSVNIHSGNLRTPGLAATPLLVIGVVRDVRYAPDRPAPLNLYLPIHQRYVAGITILARTIGPASEAEKIQALVTSMNPNLPVLNAQSLASSQSGPLETQLRLAAIVAGSVGLVGVLLAAMGIYGVTAYTVARRTREIGIRLSLGASRGIVVGLVLRQGMTLVGVGLAIGLLLGVAVGRILAAQRFGVTAPGAMTFMVAAILFVIVGLIACYAPVRRATRIAAMDALRYE